jgi:ferritin-like metal-binding protein YciE|tara:strand:- start:1437 stop:1745 length:309 start_codon:yes stop_codon:yes gene_type:complete
MSQEKLNQLELQLDNHIKECDERFSRIDERTEKLIESQERCTVALEKLTEDTSGVVALYNNAQGAVATGISIQKFGLWLLKWPLIGAGLYAVYEWFIKHLPT